MGCGCGNHLECYILTDFSFEAYWENEHNKEPVKQSPVLNYKPHLYAPNPIKEAVKPKDNVMHPAHYARWAMEPIEFIMVNDLPGWLANVIKYVMRYDAKDGLQDLYKARSYLDMKIRQLEGHPRFWEKPVSDERKLNGK